MAFLLMTSAARAEVEPGDAMEEELLKAAFVYNFAKFTRWPGAVWSAPASGLLLCTAGTDVLAAALDHLTGKTVNGHPVVVRSVDEVSEPGACHVLYLANSAREEYVEVLASISERPVLTISQSSSEVPWATMIRFFREHERISFIIDVGLSRQAGLKFSSRLLDLGVVVGQGGES
jgi:hypothetical protein